MSKSVLQRGVLQLESYNSQTLLNAMAGGSNVMGIATIAILLELLAGAALSIYAFLLVEGFSNTKSQPHYLALLVCISLFSEALYDYAMFGTFFDFSKQNPAFGIVVAFIVLIGFDIVKTDTMMKRVICAVIILAGCAWCYLLHVAFGVGCVILTVIYFFLREKRGLAIFAGVIAGIPYITGILAAYPLFIYSGKRGSNYSKYIFYIVYPLVLLIACLILNFGL